jgi:hypothetical protein
MKVSREAVERAVLGALKSAITDHGPITPDKLTSATKRVLGNLRNAGIELTPEPTPDPKKPDTHNV